MDFPTALSDIKLVVDKELQLFFEKKLKEAKNIDPHLPEIVDQISDFTLRGGKRSRPVLVWLGWQVGSTGQGIKVSENKELLNAMMAVELFQTFALIHDDIMDEDVVRRGGDTAHEHFKLLATSYKLPAQNAMHFGESMAILAGDLAFAWAQECIDSTGNMQAKAFFQQMSEQTIFGQTLDILLIQGGETIDTSHIVKYKTAYYSAIRPLQIGASLGHVTADKLAILESFGLALGMAFQLRDDNLDGLITDSEFQKKVEAHIQAAHETIGLLEVNPEISGLMSDLTRFVVERMS